MTENNKNLSNQKIWLLKSYTQQLSILTGSLIKEIKIKNNNIEIKTTPNKLRSLLSFLKKHTLCQYQQLVDIACSDVPGKKYRFSVSYLLHSILYNARIVVTVKTNEVIPLPSVTQLFESAGWLEREVYDLYGVFFYDHTDLRRILTDYGFSGYPLRKDFPLTGFIEIYYNDSTKRMAYEKVELAQEYRVFSLLNPWVPAYYHNIKKK